MNKPQQPGSPRARLQQLLAIPERQRTDEEWDELNELEIMFAAGNRQVIPRTDPPRNQGQPQGQGQGHPRSNNPGGAPHRGQPTKKRHKRPQQGKPR